MAILELKAIHGWTVAQAARYFLVESATIASWLKRIDEDEANPLVQLSQPVTRFPDFIRYMVQQLKTPCPSLGKRKIAQMLARAELHLGSTTVQRMLKERPAKPPVEPAEAPRSYWPWGSRQTIRITFITWT